VLLLYQGNLALAPGLFDEAPLEYDARPRLEFGAAVAHREKRAGRANALAGAELVVFGEALLAQVPAEGDPFLARFEPAKRLLPRAGLELVRAASLGEAGDPAGASAARARFSELATKAGLLTAPDPGSSPGSALPSGRGTPFPSEGKPIPRSARAKRAPARSLFQ